MYNSSYPPLFLFKKNQNTKRCLTKEVNCSKIKFVAVYQFNGIRRITMKLVWYKIMKLLVKAKNSRIRKSDFWCFYCFWYSLPWMNNEALFTYKNYYFFVCDNLLQDIEVSVGMRLVWWISCNNIQNRSAIPEKEQIAPAW